MASSSTVKRKMHTEALKKSTASKNKMHKQAEKNWGWYTKAVKKQKRANIKRNNHNKH